VIFKSQILGDLILGNGHFLVALLGGQGLKLTQ